MFRYKVNTLDVWGNERDGFDVNDVLYSGVVLEFGDDEPTDRDMVKALKDAGFIGKGVRYASVGIDGDDGILEVRHVPTGRPVLQLVRVTPI